MLNVEAKKPRGNRGEGTIFKNNKGIWVARYSIKNMPPKEFTGKTKAAAKAKLDNWKLLVINGEAITHTLTVEEYSQKFLFYKGQQVKRGTLKRTTYDRIERVYQSHIESHPISYIHMCNLKSMDIQMLIDEMQNKYSLSTIKKAYLFIHSMIKYGKEIKDFPDSYDPFVTVELPSESQLVVKTKEIEIMPEDEIDEFKKVALSYREDGTLSYRYGPALVFALNTGLREGELLALSKNGIIVDGIGRKRLHISETVSVVVNRDPKIEKKYIQIITPPKFPRSNRTIPLNQEAEACLEIMMNTYEENKLRSDFIISTKNGLTPTHRNIQTTLDRILKKCGMKHYGTHAMRHTFATRLLSKTSSHQDVKAVAEILGDDYRVVIKTYLHTDEDKKHGLVDLLIDE